MCEAHFSVVLDLPRELETTVSNLKQIASDILARETAAAEERIRIFTERETTALDLLRERAQNEHKILVRKLINTTTNLKPAKNVPTERSILNSPKAKAQKLPDSFPSGNASSQPISIKARAPLSGNVVRGRKVAKKRSVEKRIRHTSSMDAEAMFQFDTTDEEETTFQSEVDESDNDGELCQRENGGVVQCECFFLNCFCFILKIKIFGALLDGLDVK